MSLTPECTHDKVHVRFELAGVAFWTCGSCGEPGTYEPTDEEGENDD